MEQVIHAEAADYRIRSRIEQIYNVMLQEAGEQILFCTQEEKPVNMLTLQGYWGAIRKTAPFFGEKASLGMADTLRIDTSILNLQGNHAMPQRALEAAVAYQAAVGVPFVFAAGDEQLLRECGFRSIARNPSYEINRELLGDAVLLQARITGKAVLQHDFMEVEALRRNGLMMLSHFANLALCRGYRFFMIRSAVYFEKLLQELEQEGGGIYLIKEYGKLLGYLAVKGQGQVYEAVFENEIDSERYLVKQETKGMQVMARAADLSSLLAHIASKGKVSIALKLTDEIWAKNDGLFIWYLDEKGSRMERISENDAALFKPEVTADIGQLTAFLFGNGKLKDNLKFDSIYVINPVFVNETAPV